MLRIHRAEGGIIPPRPSVKICVDMIEWCAEHMPKWNSISISGYHIREAGATAAQELAFTLADGIGYVEECVKRGMDVDSFAQRLSFFWDVHNDFFEEIAKFRAGRKIWAEVMRDRFHAKNPRSIMLRTTRRTRGFADGAAAAEQRGARRDQALAAVLGRHAVAPHELDGRDVALPTRKREPSPSHAADHRTRRRHRDAPIPWAAPSSRP